MLMTIVIVLAVIIAGLAAALVWYMRSAKTRRPSGEPTEPLEPPLSEAETAPGTPTQDQPAPVDQPQAPVSDNANDKWLELVAGRPAAVWYDVNIETGHVRWSDAFYTLFGYSRTEPADTIEWWADHVHPDDAMRVNQTTEGLNNPVVNDWDIDYHFRKADDTYLMVHDHATVLRDGQSNPLHIMGSLEKRPEEA